MTFKTPDGTTDTFAACKVGEACPTSSRPNYPLKKFVEWGLKSMGKGLSSLDDFNTGAGLSTSGNGQYATYRNTGLDLLVELKYSNWDKASDALGLLFLGGTKKDVDVEISVHTKSSETGWSSIGPYTFYPIYPAATDQEMHRVTRYPQDVKIECAALHEEQPHCPESVPKHPNLRAGVRPYGHTLCALNTREPH